MKTSTKRIIFVLAGVVILLCAVGVYSFLIQPEYQTIMTLRGKLAAKVDAIGTYKKTIEQVNNLSSNLGGSDVQQKQASMILPIGPDASYLSNQILGVARQTGVVIDTMSVQPGALATSPSAAVKSVGQLRADVHLSTGYTQLKGFLQALENNMLVMNVTAINLSVPASASAGGAPSGLLTGTISILGYYQSE